MVVVAVAFVAVIAVVQAKKARVNLEALGGRLGLKLDTQGRYFKKYRLLGEFRGRPVEVFSYTTGSGRSKRTWAAVAVQVKATGGLTFSLKRRMTFFEVVAKLFRKNEAKIGDETFDKKWVLTTNRPDFMCTALLPEMREKILRLSGGSFASGFYKCETYKVQYAEQGSFATAKVCARFDNLAALVCDLADVVEVGAELQK